MRFFRTPSVLPFLYPSLLWRGAGNEIDHGFNAIGYHVIEKDVYLTFDDGPLDGYTDFVLKTLKEFNAKATFFCIGDNIRKHPGTFRKVIDAGHTVGNHTFNHLNGWNTSDEIYIENVRLCRSEMMKHGAPEPKLFRPPYGRIKRSQINSLKNEYKIVMWDVLSYDYDQSLRPHKISNGIKQALRSGSIVVFHDSVKAGDNVLRVLPNFMDYCLGHAYNFKAL